MAKRELVTVLNERTQQYGEVPLYFANHPVYGADLVRVDKNGVPCNCGSDEPDVVVDGVDGETVEEPPKSVKDDKSSESKRGK